MKKNNITNKITPCCGLPFSVIYWWVSNLTLNSEADRSFVLSKIGQSGTIAIDGWKVLINSGTLEADASLTKAEFLAWFDCGKQPKCEQLKIIIESYKLGYILPTENPDNIATIDGIFAGIEKNGNTFSKEQIISLLNNSLSENYLNDKNLFENPSFNDGFNLWNKNDSFNVTPSSSMINIDTSVGTNPEPAIYQVFPNLEKGNYSLIFRIKNNNANDENLSVGVVGLATKEFVLKQSSEFQTFMIDFEVDSNMTNAVPLMVFNPLKNYDLDYYYFIDKKNNILEDILNKIDSFDLQTESIENKIFTEVNFSNLSNTINVKKQGNDFLIEISQLNFIFDMNGGYRKLVVQSVLVTHEETAFLSYSATEYVEVDLTVKGTGENVYIWKERYDASRPKLRKNTIGINYGGWQTTFSVFEVKEKVNTLQKWFPKKETIKSPIYSYLKPFFEKMQLRNQDVTLVSIGDSISTDLNWTDKRADANERPPFCTEYNINSYLEEKLRWKEQKYRRFDFSGIFTEILGGGSSTVKETDSNWGVVGGAYLFPITKVIDGGTNSGVSFKMLEKIKRISLIVHSDSQFATQTKVTISSGNGKVQVFDGTNWVEANNFVTSFKETLTIPTRSEIRDNAQKRLKFRSLTDLTEKTITVQNVGTGRFGYWGVEYSPKEYLFTYVCSSKGSHGIDFLKLYQEWMVDDFNPDLVLQQCCILNQGLGQETRSKSPQDFANDFKLYHESFVAKNYLVLPYILWAATYSFFIDNNGNFLSGTNSNTGIEQTCFDDVNYLSKMYEDKNVPVINLFSRITESGLEKAIEEEGNIYSSALVGSGKNGGTFTIDGIHLNKMGVDVCLAMIETYFNF